MKLKNSDYVVLVILLILGLVPDPSDVLDFGLPLFEGVVAGVYYFWRSRK